MIARIVILAALLLAAAPGRACAHARSVSYATWTVDAHGARMRLRMSLLDVDALEATLRAVTQGVAPRVETLGDALQARLWLASSGGLCEALPGSFEAGRVSGAQVLFEWRVTCASTTGLRLGSELPELLPGHLHFTRVVSDGEAGAELVLGGPVRELEVAPRAGAGERAGEPAAILARYVPFGIEHILSGWDHVVFLLVLLLMATSLRSLLVVVTGFTVGHSVTLALATLGWASPHVAAIEALIGLSIVLVAVENVWLSEERARKSRAVPAGAVAVLILVAILAFFVGSVGPLALAGLALFTACHFGLLSRSERPERWRWAFATLFGLVHGFGFAGVLSEAGIERADLPYALLGFNGGVELGQLAVVLAAWPLLCVFRRRGGSDERALVRWGSAAAACAGAFAFVSRTF